MNEGEMKTFSVWGMQKAANLKSYENLLSAHQHLKNGQRSSPNIKEIIEKELEVQKGKNIGMGKNRSKYNRLL